MSKLLPLLLIRDAGRGGRSERGVIGQGFVRDTPISPGQGRPEITGLNTGRSLTLAKGLIGPSKPRLNYDPSIQIN